MKVSVDVFPWKFPTRIKLNHSFQWKNSSFLICWHSFGMIFWDFSTLNIVSWMKQIVPYSAELATNQQTRDLSILFFAQKKRTELGLCLCSCTQRDTWVPEWELMMRWKTNCTMTGIRFTLWVCKCSLVTCILRPPSLSLTHFYVHFFHDFFSLFLSCFLFYFVRSTLNHLSHQAVI